MLKEAIKFIKMVTKDFGNSRRNMSLKKTIIYIGDFLFPHGNAGGQLVFANGNIFKELGYNVVFIGNSKTIDSNTKLSDTEKKISGFKSYTIPFKKQISDIKNISKINAQIINLFNSYNGDIKVVICYGSPTLAITILSIRNWCRKNNVTFIGNLVDISALSHGSISNRILKWADKTYLRSIFKYSSDGVIAVSDFIKRYFEYGNKPMIVIPPLVVTERLPQYIYNSSDKLNIVYAGVPFPVDGRKVDESSYKDRLDITIDLLGDVYKNNKKFTFNIYGITKDEYLGVVGKHKQLLSELSDTIFFHGNTKNEDVLRIVSNADFTINLRNVNRMTTAGFSTKFVESISCGTPAITTNTSDLSKYLIEGENGFFINIDDRDEAVNKLLEIFSLNPDRIRQMKKQCYESRLFDFREYVDEMKRFLDRIANNK